MPAAALVLVMYSAQILLVVSIATLAAALCRVSLPVMRLAYWRAVGAVCLGLPLLSSARAEGPSAAVEFSAVIIEGIDSPVPAPFLRTVGAAILATWAVGVVTRLGWLLLGAFRMRQIRRRSTPAVLGTDFDALRISLAPRAEFRWTCECGQPATFGILHPVILLPRQFGALNSEAQRAVAHHELLHVARLDWLWIVVEELVRAVFWFHPGVWWLLEQLQLNREQVIDQLVAARTASKRAYMSALMAFADEASGVSPSIAFLRRRHLKSRIRQLSKESHMSRMRLAWTTMALVVVMSGTTRGVISALPLAISPLGLQTPPARQLEIPLADSQRGSGPALKVLKEVKPEYPKALLSQKVEGVVRVASTIDTQGRPQNVRPISGPEPLRQAAVNAMRQWRFEPPAEPTTVECEFRFSTTRPASAAVGGTSQAPPVSSHEQGVTLPIVVREVRPQYTQTALDAKIEGDVVLNAVVLADGTVGDVRVTQSLDTVHGLDQQAVDAMKQWQFKPGTKNGTPVAVLIDVQMRFTLK